MYPSVPALAASTSFETSKQRYSRVSLRLFLDFDSWIFKSYGVKKPICKLDGAYREPFSRSFGTNDTQHLREGQLVGRMLLQSLATGATAVKQARYRRRPTRGSEALVRACAVEACPIMCMWALPVQCKTMHGVMPAYEFRRG